MAYTTEFIKVSVKKIDNHNYMLSVNVKVNDGVTDVLEKTYSVRYCNSWSVGDVSLSLYRKIKADWNNYVDEKSIFDNAAFDTMIGNVKTNFDNYINT
jgi:hypothetical protein